MATPKPASSESFADPARAVEWETRRLRLMEMVGEGKSVKYCCDELSISAPQYYKLLREAAEAVRDRTLDLITERFAMHDWRYEAMLRQVQARIDACPVEDHIAFAALIRAAIAVLERQAKLFGLDRAKNEGGRNQNDWLDKAPASELVKMAKSLGVTIPAGFVPEEASHVS